MKKLMSLILLVLQVNAYAAIKMPLFVGGAEPKKVDILLNVPAEKVGQISKIYLETNNLSYAGKGSIQLNDGIVIGLSNSTANVLGLGGKLGGIGSKTFSNLKMIVPINPGSIIPGNNKVSFYFNGTDGTSSSYRVRAINFIDNDGKLIFGSSSFKPWLDTDFTPIFTDDANIKEGERLWKSSTLLNSPLNKTQMGNSHCQNCHAQDGSDLKYFRFERAAIIERSKFHGLLPKQGQQIQSYIASRPIIAYGRPWNPPFQPGIGLDSKPVKAWSAGAGIEAVLDDDLETLNYIKPEDYSSKSTLNLRELPLAFQFMDWNQWLPTIDPEVSFGTLFTNSPFFNRYNGNKALLSFGFPLRQGLSSVDSLKYIKTRLKQDFAMWGAKERSDFVDPIISSAIANGTYNKELAQRIYAVGQWMAVKTWEITEEFDLVQYSSEILGPGSEARSWVNDILELASPRRLGIPNKDDSTALFGSVVASNYITTAWDKLQLAVQSSRAVTFPDWGYILGHSQHPGRLTDFAPFGSFISVSIKSTQARDNGKGPLQDGGWNPRWNTGIGILASGAWSKIPAEARKFASEQIFRSWMSKNMEYTADIYYQAKMASLTETPPVNIAGSMGSQLRALLPYLNKIGVDKQLLENSAHWAQTIWPKLDWMAVLNSTPVVDDTDLSDTNN